jgi:hypothetical protein
LGGCAGVGWVRPRRHPLRGVGASGSLAALHQTTSAKHYRAEMRPSLAVNWCQAPSTNAGDPPGGRRHHALVGYECVGVSQTFARIAMRWHGKPPTGRRVRSIIRVTGRAVVVVRARRPAPGTQHGYVGQTHQTCGRCAGWVAGAYTRSLFSST